MTYEIEVDMEGDKWFALYGENIQVGCVGFGDTPVEALRALIDDMERLRGRYL